VLSQWLIVVFHAHAGSKPTLVPASAVQAVREPTKADEQSGAGFVHAGAREWLHRLSEQATKGKAGAVQLPALVPFATALAALRAHGQAKSPAPKKAAARELTVPEGTVCKVKVGQRSKTEHRRQLHEQRAIRRRCRGGLRRRRERGNVCLQLAHRGVVEDQRLRQCRLGVAAQPLRQPAAQLHRAQ